MRSRRAATRSSRSAVCSRTTPARSPPLLPTSGSAACSCRSTGSTGRMSVYDKVGNILLSRLMGADVRLDPAGFDIGFRPSWEQALADVEERGGKPYAIPAGASDHPLGGLGFARWADEVEEQERELGVFFDTIVVCTVTGSTHAGMIAGFAGQERPRRVSGSTAPRRSSRPGRRSHGSRAAPPTRSGSGANCATTRSSCSTNGTPAPTAFPTRRPSTRFASARGSRGCSPTPSTRESPWPR